MATTLRPKVLQRCSGFGGDKAACPPTATIYVRVSTSKQEEEGTSLASQEAACLAYAAERGYTVVSIFRETHSGAALFERPRLSELRASVRSGEVGVIVAYALDRLSRNQAHLGLLLSEAEHAGTTVEFVTEKLEDTPEGRLLQSVRGFVAEVERLKIGERTVRGKRARIESGKLHNHSSELFGYQRDKEAGVRGIIGAEAVTIRRIFQAVANDAQPVRGLARQLNAEGVATPSDGKRVFKDGRVSRWNPSTLYRILAEPAYMGDTVLWRFKWRGGAAAGPMRDPSEWVRLPEGTTPPIVTPETWRAAQERLKTGTAATTRNTTRPYVLRGLIFCSVCGKRMYATPEHGVTYVYRCSSRQTASGACGGKRVPGAMVEDWAWQEVSAILRDPEIIAIEVRRQREAGPEAALQTLQADRDATDRLLLKIETQRDRLVRRYADAGDDSFPWELLEREIARLESERRAVVATVAERDKRLQQHEAATVQLDSLHGYCLAVGVNLDRADFTTKRNAIEALVERIDANGREWKLTGSIPMGQNAGVSSTTLS